MEDEAALKLLALSNFSSTCYDILLFLEFITTASILYCNLLSSFVQRYLDILPHKCIADLYQYFRKYEDGIDFDRF